MIGGATEVRVENTREESGLGGKRPHFLGGIFDSLSDVFLKVKRKDVDTAAGIDREARLSQLEDARRVGQGIMYLRASQIR
jgi:hypothetical protein